MAIHIWVVDDFTNQENSLIRKNSTGGVCEIDRAFDAIAKAELAGQQDRRVADGNPSAGLTDPANNRRVKMGGDLGGDAFHHLRSAHIDPRSFRFTRLFAHGCGGYSPERGAYQPFFGLNRALHSF